MFTSVDKAWAALLGSGAFLGGYYLGFDLGLGDGIYATLGTLITTALTWAVPNKASDPAP